MANEITQHHARNSLEVAKASQGFSLVPTTFGEVVEFAKDMCRAGTAIPKHLRENPGACMAVALQAFEWGMSPFAVANKSYSVNDRIAYEAQLFAAVVNTRSGLKGRLKYKFEGSGETLRCTVTGILDGEEATYTSPKFSDITPKNSPLWKSDPEQQLGYYSARAWARRHVPEVILGVYDREEVAAFDEPEIAPPAPPSPTKPKKAIAEKPKAEEAEIIEVDPPAPKEEAPETERTYGDFETLGDFMTGLEIALGQCQDEIQIEEIWSEFDPMATLEGDEDSQQLAVNMKAKAIDKMRVPSGPLFSDN